MRAGINKGLGRSLALPKTKRGLQPTRGRAPMVLLRAGLPTPWWPGTDPSIDCHLSHTLPHPEAGNVWIPVAIYGDRLQSLHA